MAKTLHYNFDGVPSLTGADHPGTLTPDLTITRATTGKMKDSDGWLREVQSGEARFPGASFSHNALLYSEDLSQSTWQTNFVTKTVNQIANPLDGDVTADLISETVDNQQHKVYQAINGEKGGDTVLCSAYVKGKDRTNAYMQIFDGSSTYTTFNLSTGAIGGTDTHDDAGIEDAGDGWYRIWVAHQISGSANIYIGVSSADNTSAYVGDTAKGLYVYGAQAEIVSGRWDSENLLLQSNTFSTTWANTRSSETSGQSDPDGGTNAWSLNSDATSANSHYIAQVLTLPEPGRYRFSVKAKASNQSWITLAWAGVGRNSIVYYNLSTGAVGTILSSLPTGGVVDTGTVSLGGGWYQVWMEVEAWSADLAGTFEIYAAEGDNDVTYDGTSTEEIVIYQAQVERTKPSQTAPGTYTATTTAAVTNYSPSTYIATTSAAVSSLSGSNDGLLVEEARTNICKQSEDFSTTWTNTNGALSTNQTTAPDGSLTADKHVDNGATGTGQVVLTQTVTVATATTYTWSIYAKADQLAWITLGIEAFTTPGSSYAYFDLANGAFGTVGAGFDDNGFESVGNGWYRIWIVFTTDAVDITGQLKVFVAEADNDATVDLDGTSSIFLWGAQLEAGAFPTSYIPTTTGSVTRNADVVDTSDVTWVNESEGSFFTNYALNTTASTQPFIFSLSDGSTSNRYTISEASGTLYWFGASATTTYFNFGVAGIGDTASHRSASCYNTNDTAHYVDGTAATPDTSVTVASGLNLLNVGSLQGGTGFFTNGLIKEIAYWNERLPNADLLEYSTNGVPLAFPGSVAGDGGHIWPPRANDPRWTQIITDSGITTTGNFIDDVHQALEALASTTGAMDELWKKFKALYSVTDTSEPFTY